MLKTFLINKIFGNKGIHCTVLNNIAFQIHYIRRGQGENHAQVLHKMAPITTILSHFGFNVVIGRYIWVPHKMAPTTIFSHLGFNVVVGRDIWVPHKMAPTTNILSHLGFMSSLVGSLGPAQDGHHHHHFIF